MATNNSLSGRPGVQSIVDDIKDCVDQLKSDFNDTRRPVTDDCKVFQRFCVKLEFLLRHDQIEKSGFIGGRKDYWNYFMEGLNSVKGVNDGLKFVKSHSNEFKTNSGRGRAFVRFCLMYQRLADCLQLCVSNSKLTSQWYKRSSVWRNQTQSTYLISILYDLNDVTFDLGALGYDLDNGWPTFSRSDGGQKWNISFSRTSSMSSLNQSNLPDSPFMSSSFVEPEIQEEDELSSGGERFTSSFTSNTEPEFFAEQRTDVPKLMAERDVLSSQVTELQSQIALLTDSQTEDHGRRDDAERRVGETEKRVVELELRNAQLVENLSQLAQSNTSSASSQIERMEKYQELMTRYSDLQQLISEREKSCSQLEASKSALEVDIASLSLQCAEQGETIKQITEDKTNLEDHLTTIANSLMEKSSLIEKMTETHSTDLRTSQSKCEELLRNYESLQQAHTVLKTDHRTLENNHNALESQFNSVSFDLNALQTSHKQLELSQTGAVDYNQSLKEQLATVLSNHKSSQENVLVLQLEIIKLQKKHEELNSKDQRSQTEISRLTQECGDLQNIRDSLQKDKDNLQKISDNLQQELVDAQKQTEIWHNKCLNISEEKTTVETRLSEQEKLVTSLLADQETFVSQNNKLNSNHIQLQSALASLQSVHDMLQVDLSKQQSQSTQLQSAHVELQSKHESTEKLQETLSQQVEEQKTEHEGLKSKHSSLQAEYDELQSEHSLLQGRLAELQSDLESSTDRAHTLQSALDASATEQALLQEQHNVIKQERDEMENQLMNIHTAHEKLQGTHAEVDNSRHDLQAAHTALEARYSKLEADYGAKTLELETLTTAYGVLQIKLSTDLDKHQQGALQVSLDRERLVARNKELEEEVSRVSNRLTTICEEKDQLSSKLLEEEQMKSQLSNAVVEVNAEIDTLRVALKSLKTQEVEKSRELSDLQSRLESTKLELGSNQTVMEQQIGALRFQISSQQMEADLALEGYKAQQEDVQKMSQTISAQERVVAAIELQVDNLQLQKTLESDSHQQQINELVGMLDDKEAELVALTQELEAHVAQGETLAETNTSLRESVIELKLGSGERQARTENELHQLREDNIILKKRLVKLIKDKDSLWQTTDALISRQRQLTQVKWLDSSNVLNCMGCRATFTIILRKHHCRLCGRVFCWQCSNNWVDIAASDKKSRVCNQCYIDQTEEPPQALNSSNITNDNNVDAITLPVEVRREIRCNNDGLQSSPQSEHSVHSSTPDVLHNVETPLTSDTSSHPDQPNYNITAAISPQLDSSICEAPVASGHPDQPNYNIIAAISPQVDSSICEAPVASGHPDQPNYNITAAISPQVDSSICEAPVASGQPLHSSLNKTDTTSEAFHTSSHAALSNITSDSTGRLTQVENNARGAPDTSIHPDHSNSNGNDKHAQARADASSHDDSKEDDQQQVDAEKAIVRPVDLADITAQTANTQLEISEEKKLSGHLSIDIATPEPQPNPLSVLESLKSEYCAVLSSGTRLTEDYCEVMVDRKSTYTVCVVVDTEETTLTWRFRTQAKAVDFRLTYKPDETSFSQESEDLIPECRCRSHRQEVQGEMISHNSGFYIFSFINKLERSVDLQYLISMK